MKTALTLFSFAVIIAGCNHLDQNMDQEPIAINKSYSNWQVHFLEGYGLPLSIKSPPQVEQLIELRWNNNFSRVEISAGKGVDFFISEATETLIGKRFEIESGIFQIEYLLDEEHCIVYKATLPDGSLPYYHFFKIIQRDDLTVQLENNPLIEFSKNDIDEMLAMIETLEFSFDDDN